MNESTTTTVTPDQMAAARHAESRQRVYNVARLDLAAARQANHDARVALDRAIVAEQNALRELNDATADLAVALRDEPRTCGECGDTLVPPNPPGQPGDDTYYCAGCGQCWTLDGRPTMPPIPPNA